MNGYLTGARTLKIESWHMQTLTPVAAPAGCRFDNPRCSQWLQSRLHDNSSQWVKGNFKFHTVYIMQTVRWRYCANMHYITITRNIRFIDIFTTWHKEGSTRKCTNDYYCQIGCLHAVRAVITCLSIKTFFRLPDGWCFHTSMELWSHKWFEFGLFQQQYIYAMMTQTIDTKVMYFVFNLAGPGHSPLWKITKSLDNLHTFTQEPFVVNNVV